MTEQALDLRTFLWAVRRFKAVVIAVVGLGVLAGVGYAFLNPPLPTSTALVVLPSTAARSISSEVVVATIEPVLTGAVAQVHPSMTLKSLRSHVKATRVTPEIVSIIAQGKTPAQAKSAANAVAESFIDWLGRNGNGLGRQRAGEVPATQVTQGSLKTHLIAGGVAGLLAGTLIGAIIAAAVGRSRHRLRERDDLAAAVRAPVLASIPARSPTDAAGWMRLLEDYEPTATDADALSRILHLSGVDVESRGQLGAAGQCQIMFVSLGSDDRALALGPQLAAYAASRGIPTALVIGPQQDEKAIANLRTACETRPDSLPRRSRDLELVVTPDGDDYWIQDAVLVVVVCVVKGSAPRLADLPTTTTMLAVSAGAATAPQLARIANEGAASGHPIDGVIATNPDLSDETTGYTPRPTGSPGDMQPTRVTG
jgi:capsular polysaccharide biosynthesis protein